MKSIRDSEYRFVFIPLLVVLLGCGRGNPPENPNLNVTDHQSHSVSSNDAATSIVTKKEPAIKVDEDSALAAVQKTLKALEAGQLAEAYDFLPEAYQADIDGLVHEFADRMDHEVWAKLVTTLRKTIHVLRTKKDFIFAMDFFRNRPEAEPYRKQWEPTLDLTNALIESDLSNLSKIKQVSARSLLSFAWSPTMQQFDAIGRAIGADVAKQFAGVTVTSIKIEGNEQTIGLRGPGDEKPIEVVYIKQEGRWLPRSLVENWKSGIAADRAWLDKLPERIKSVKSQLLDAAYQADDILDQLLVAENREQFEQAAGPAILSLAVEWPRLLKLASQAMVGSNANPNVTISINRELTEREQTKLVTQILKPLTQAGSDYTLLSNDGRTFCRVFRAADLAGLQEDLANLFGLPATSISFDKNRATIQIDLAP